MLNFDKVAEFDPDLMDAMNAELGRQRNNLELIASENLVSEAVMQAMGSHLTNKYAEGYPGKRYYGGCEYVDIVENLARERAKKLFGCEYVNVQPHSGAQANHRHISFWPCRSIFPLMSYPNLQLQEDIYPVLQALSLLSCRIFCWNL